jgi:hypothetical protein
MAKNENAVMYAVEQVCSLYGVQVTREQSRALNVQGAAGRWRPMFIGSWTDGFGKIHRQGKSDFLARPRIRQPLKISNLSDRPELVYSVPLWIECKSKTGRQTTDQSAFEQWVESNGDYYLLLREDVRPLICWFELHGVEKSARCNDLDLANVVAPMDASQLYLLPCKWCGFAREAHKKPIFACPLELAQCNPKLIGKVWSPNLRKVVTTNAEGTRAGSARLDSAGD